MLYMSVVVRRYLPKRMNREDIGRCLPNVCTNIEKGVRIDPFLRDNIMERQSHCLPLFICR